MQIDLSDLVRLGHEFDSGSIANAGPDTAADVHAQCRLCGTVFRFENPMRRAGASAEWRLSDESRRDLEHSCHSRRALMLQHYSRIRSLIDEKQGRFRS
jgi:hypothetical protein